MGSESKSYTLEMEFLEMGLGIRTEAILTLYWLSYLIVLFWLGAKKPPYLTLNW